MDLHRVMHTKDADIITNSVDPDQAACSQQSDLGLQFIAAHGQTQWNRVWYIHILCDFLASKGFPFHNLFIFTGFKSCLVTLKSFLVLHHRADYIF